MTKKKLLMLREWVNGMNTTHLEVSIMDQTDEGYYCYKGQHNEFYINCMSPYTKYCTLEMLLILLHNFQNKNQITWSFCCNTGSRGERLLKIRTVINTTTFLGLVFLFDCTKCITNMLFPSTYIFTSLLCIKMSWQSIMFASCSNTSLYLWFVY